MEQIPDESGVIQETDAAVPEQKPRRLRWWFLGALCIDLVIVAALVCYWLLFSAPSDFVPVTVTIEPGSTINDIVLLMEERGVTRSEVGLYAVLLSIHRDSNIKAGKYEFDEPRNALTLASYLTSTTPKEELVRLTLPEGMTLAAYGAIAAETIEEFDTDQFIALTEGKEGYLHPETYFIPPSYTASQLAELLMSETNEILTELDAAIASSSLTEYEVLVLASVLEREANSEESFKMVAGILQNRLEIGMPLQADATIEYILETPLNELAPGELATNLRELDSPYNSYLYLGLPPTPIGNPGRAAIEAVLAPTPSEYIFYITGNDGVFYYAETYNQHLVNIERYLR